MLKVRFKVGSCVYAGYLVRFYQKDERIWYVVQMDDGRLVHTKGVMYD